MSEIQKHIESCRSEDPLAQTMEACGNENDLQAALQPLLAETMPGYVPVETTAPTSPIAELPGVLISIIRRVATKPLTMFGERPAKQSLLGTLLDTWNAIRQRLSGNPSLGIPDRRAEMTAHSLPTALALLNDRKISDLGDVPDGMSLLQLVLSRTSGITKLSDPYVWDVCYRDQLFNLCAALPGLNDLYLRCKRLTGYSYSANLEWVPSQITKVNGSSDVFELPDLERFEGSSYNGCPTKNQNFKIWRLPKMVYSRAVFASNCSWVEEIYAPSSKEIGGYAGGGGLRNYTALRKMTMGQIVTLGDHSAESFTESLNLIHMEICGNGGYLENSFSFAGWSPTNALDASRTDLIEEGSTAENNLQQFLSNFREHIAKKLANRTGLSKLTLTLSEDVFSAVFTNESGSTEEIVARNAIRDEIRGEITDRNWKVTDSTNNFNN